MFRMVDISQKKFSKREAVAEIKVLAKKETICAIKLGKLPKGDALSVAKAGAILSAKNTAQLIPMCHQINLNFIDVNFVFKKNRIIITSLAKADYSTGVEMEALVACSAAALNIYDFAKAIDKRIVISDLKLVSKRGGKSGDFNG